MRQWSGEAVYVHTARQVTNYQRRHHLVNTLVMFVNAFYVWGKDRLARVVVHQAFFPLSIKASVADSIVPGTS